MSGQNECPAAAGLPCRDDADSHRGQMEGTDPARPLDGYETVRRAEKVARRRVTEGADGAASRDGGKRACGAKGLRGGPAPRGIFPDRARPEPATDSGRDAKLGQRLSGCPPLIGYSRRPAYPKLKAWGTPATAHQTGKPRSQTGRREMERGYQPVPARDADVSTSASAPEREERGAHGGVRKNAAVRPPRILLTRSPQNAERNRKSRRPPKKNTTGA